MNGRLLQRAGMALALILTLTWLAKPLAAQGAGTVRAWGDNQFGQLGNGTNTFSNVPVPVSGLSSVLLVAAGAYHSLALQSDGTVWAWGLNNLGQLGDYGSVTNRNTPVQVDFLYSVVDIAAGDDFSLALISDGQVWSWGANDAGQLGQGMFDNNAHTSPWRPIPGLSGVSAIAAGSRHGLALKFDGTVWAWGDNYYGQLGNGSSYQHGWSASATPVAVSGLSGAVRIAAGQNHSLALKSDGTVRAWGYNYYGQLGNGASGNNTDHSLPIPVSGLTGVIGIAAGTNHSLAIKADDMVWAWGFGIGGAVGNGTWDEVISTPVIAWLWPPALAIAGGGGTNGVGHSLGVRQDGTVWAWGHNYSGELGNGTLNGVAGAANFPVQVVDLAGASKIAAGFAHSLAIGAPVVVASPAALDFGTISAGSTSATQYATITNTGPVPLTINSLSLGGAYPGEFTVTGPALPVTIAPGSSMAAGVRFVPKYVCCELSGTLLIGDAFGGSRLVTLSGTGYTPNAPADVAVSQSVTLSGRRITYTITVKNNGHGSASGVTLKNSVPAQTQFVSISGSACAFSAKTLITCDLSTLPGSGSGMQTTVTLVVDVTATLPVQVSNTATVSSTTPDPSTGNNSSTLVTAWGSK